MQGDVLVPAGTESLNRLRNSLYVTIDEMQMKRPNQQQGPDADSQCVAAENDGQRL